MERTTVDVVEQIVAVAVRAPSVHNTQPWRFAVSAGGLDLHADRGRQLTALDPTGRQLTVSCGAALGLARLAAAALGRACAVTLLPDPDDPDHLARLVLGGPAPAAEDDLALARQAGRRRTVRDRFDPVPLGAGARTVLERDADREHCGLLWLDDPDQRAALAVLTERADRIERADPALRAELARWSRDGAGAVDGVPAAVAPQVPASLRASDVPLREFGRPPAPAGADPQHLPMPAERPDLAVLCTRYDGPTGWLEAGQALVRVLLRASALGVAASPLGQALDPPWTRRRLRTELGLPGHPQQVLRFGHARLDGPRTPRRPVTDVLGDSS